MNEAAASHPSAARALALPNALALAWTSGGWLLSFPAMAAPDGWMVAGGVLLCAHCMILAAYLLHDAAHHALFSGAAANRRAGEWLNFIAGSSYASFERIRHMHIRHHRDRADLACFDFKALLARRPAVRRLLEVAEWAYLPATDALMHLQVVWRPFFVPTQRPHRRRVLGMLMLRGTLLLVLGWWSWHALLGYLIAYALLLRVLNFFDAFHHTFEQWFIAPDLPIGRAGRDHAYEQANTYSNLVSLRWPWLNLLVLNFGFHNAHHERVAVPWHRLPALHRELYGDAHRSVLPLRALLGAWHRHRVRRVAGEEYGAAAGGAELIGAHGVSFLTVV